MQFSHLRHCPALDLDFVSSSLHFAATGHWTELFAKLLLSIFLLTQPVNKNIYSKRRINFYLQTQIFYKSLWEQLSPTKTHTVENHNVMVKVFLEGCVGSQRPAIVVRQDVTLGHIHRCVAVFASELLRNLCHDIQSFKHYSYPVQK